MSLRSKLIKLAHDEPTLRPTLLPLLKGASGQSLPPDVAATLGRALKAQPGLARYLAPFVDAGRTIVDGQSLRSAIRTAMLEFRTDEPKLWGLLLRVPLEKRPSLRQDRSTMPYDPTVMWDVRYGGRYVGTVESRAPEDGGDGLWRMSGQARPAFKTRDDAVAWALGYQD